MKWFRFYEEVLHDPKVQRLSAPSFRCWVNLLCLASSQENRGKLPNIKAVAYALRTTERKATSVLGELEQAGLLERTGDGFSVHNWASRQPNSDASRDRMRASRDRHGDAPEEIQRRTEESRGEESTEPSEKQVSPQSPPTEASALPFRESVRAFVSAPPKQQVARLIDLAARLGIPRSGLAAALVRDYGHGQEVVNAVQDAARYADGDQWEYMRKVLANAGNAADQRRATSTRWPQEDRATPPSERVLTAAEARDLIRSGQAHGAQGDEASAVQGDGAGDGDGASS